MTTDTAAEIFYKTIGDELGGRVAPCTNGLNMQGVFTPRELVLITKAYATYLQGGSAADAENAVKLENEVPEATPDREREEDEQRAY
jgi:hypothetical protein